VFVGFSTNLTYGASNNVTIARRSDMVQNDSILFEPSDTSKHVIILREGISIGEKFGTMFSYPQQHIEKILIPNLIKIRNSVLEPATMTETAAQNKANNQK
jgi:hypothetical protein